MATGLGPRPELLPGGGGGPAGGPGLGVPESGGNGLGRTAVALQQIRGVLELPDDGEIGGHGRLYQIRDNTLLSRVLLASKKGEGPGCWPGPMGALSLL